MFRRPTLFVLGAGASAEVGFPVGSELSSWISENLDYSESDATGRFGGGNEEIHRALNLKSAEENYSGKYIDAARRIARGLVYSKSIDEFVNKHLDDPDLQFCAKVAISYRIFLAERKSCVFIDPSNNYNGFRSPKAISESWYLEFAQILFDGLAKTNVGEVFKSVSIVNFNYDRSLEHFIHRSLRDSYGLSDQAATEALIEIPIVRPYGSLGWLPWQSAHDSVKFGYAPGAQELGRMTGRLRTFYEQETDQNIQAKISRFVSEAERVVILGFGFHPQNLEILRGGDIQARVKAVYATAYGESDSAVKNIEQQIRRMFGNPLLGEVHVHNQMKSAALMGEYSRALSS